MAQPLHRGIRCCVGGSEATFELVYRVAVDDVRHSLGGSTDAQWVVGITPLMETGCTLASAWAETVQNAPLPSGQVGTRHGNSWVIDDLGVSWKISLPSISPEVFCGRRRVNGPYWLAVWQTRHWMVEDVLVNRNVRFSLEISEWVIDWVIVVISVVQTRHPIARRLSGTLTASCCSMPAWRWSVWSTSTAKRKSYPMHSCLTSWRLIGHALLTSHTTSTNTGNTLQQCCQCFAYCSGKGHQLAISFCIFAVYLQNDSMNLFLIIKEYWSPQLQSISKNLRSQCQCHCHS